MIPLYIEPPVSCKNGKIFCPPLAHIYLGTFNSEKRSAAYWNNCYIAQLFLRLVVTQPSIEHQKKQFELKGIIPIPLKQSIFNGEFHFEENGDEVLKQSSSASQNKAGRQVLRDANGIPFKIIDNDGQTELQTEIDPQHLGTFNLYYLLPLTVEAFAKCQKVLQVMLDNNYLTAEDMQKLQKQTYQSIKQGNATIFKPIEGFKCSFDATQCNQDLQMSM